MKWGSKELTTRVKYRVLGTTELSGRVKNGVYRTTKLLNQQSEQNGVLGTAHLTPITSVTCIHLKLARLQCSEEFSGPASRVSNRARPLDYFDRHGNGDAS